MQHFLVSLIFFFLTFLSTIFGDGWNIIYLASFPRSGNHWVRFLVEESTHIATSSVYRDRDFFHLPTLFPWGGYSTDHGYQGQCRYPTKNDPILLKTHYPFLPDKRNLEPKATICLIRHPIDAFWSFHIYQQRGKKVSKINEKQLIKFIIGWRMFYEFWEKQPGVLFIRYEDLQENTSWQLRCILQAAGFSFESVDIERAVAKYPPQGTPLKHMSYYDVQSLEIMKRELADLLMRYNYDL